MDFASVIVIIVKMKICFVGPAESIHIQKFCDWFKMNGHEVHLISFTDEPVHSAIQHKLSVNVNTKGPEFQKIKYLFSLVEIKKHIKKIKPDIINVHYASSYGLVMALSGIKGYVLSVWGADIYEFPQKSIIHREIIKFSLKKASYLFSTSKVMAQEAGKYTNKSFEITPFGVDVDLFNPSKRNRINDNKFIVGTVKALTDKYGIRNIIEAVAQLSEEGEKDIIVRIAGKGSKENEYKELAANLGISEKITWLGFISQDQAAKEWANMDIGLIPSTQDSESFGVSAVEAQACGIPVIISDVAGLMEATIPNVTSVVVPRNQSHELAISIKKLKYDNVYRQQLGENGRKNVESKYSIDICFKMIEEKFKQYRLNMQG